MRRILLDQRIIARDQKKVFVELANRNIGAPRTVERRYRLKAGKANAYVEFDVEDADLRRQRNRLTGVDEYYIRGSLELSSRKLEGFENR